MIIIKLLEFLLVEIYEYTNIIANIYFNSYYIYNEGNQIRHIFITFMLKVIKCFYQ